MKPKRPSYVFTQSVVILTISAVLLAKVPFGNYEKTSLSMPSVNVYALQTQIGATVGDFTLYVNGIIAPSASIVLSTPNGTFLQSVAANSAGAFVFDSVAIVKGITGFCFDAVDFKNLGHSVTCITIPPAEANMTMSDIFLPPTLGLSKTEITSDSSAKAFGYTMPGAGVVVHIGSLTKSSVADSNGYYEIDIDSLPVGEYSLYAVASYQGRESIKPTKFVQIKVLGVSGPSAALATENRLWLLLLIILCIVIGIVIFIIRKKRSKRVKK